VKIRKLASILSSIALTSAAVVYTPGVASAVVDPACAAVITKGGTTALEADVSVETNGIYCVATFKTVATDYEFTVPAGLTKVDYLVVGGGGGGASGGGGGGGFLDERNYVVTPGAQIPIAVGAGGSGGNAGRGPDLLPTKGSNSSFGDEVAYGGGGGGAETSSATRYQDGASGGGARFDCVNPNCGEGDAGVGISGQGNGGAYSPAPSFGGGGGGGGAGGAGFNSGRSHIGGNGGDGLASDITGQSIYYAGGGGGGINSNDNRWLGLDSSDGLISSYSSAEQYTNGGGQGGKGGGGRGSSYGYAGSCPLGGIGDCANATAGTPNTGGGGGGTDPEDILGKAGGSGVVIVRWVSNTNLKTITFNSNTASVSTSTQKVASGVSTSLVANSFSRTGWVFNRWSTNPDGTGTTYADGAALTTASDLTLYAQWLEGVTKTVTFNSNTGSGSMPNQVSGISTGLSANTFTKDGYTFAGWNTAANGTGFSYADGASYNFSADTTMYAQWNAIVATFKVTFYGNSSAATGATASQIASSSTPLNLNGFSRHGYNFLGWHTAYNSQTALYLDGQNYGFSADLGLYAIWVAQAQNTVTYNSNGSVGAPSTGTMANQVASSSTLISPNSFSRDGYTFTGWNTAADGSGVSYLSNYVYSFASARTLYAQWGKNITVSYNANTSESGTVAAQQATYVGSPGVNLDNNSGNLVKAGYRLAGWNTEDDGTGTPYALGQSSVSFLDDTQLFALWTPAVYAVIYSGNGHTAGTEPNAQTFQYGSALNISDNSGALAKTGHTFSGWNTAADGTGLTIEPAASNVALSNDTVLFAKWARVPVQNVPTTETPIQSPVQRPIMTSPAKSPVSITVSGFAGGSSKLTAVMKAKIKAFMLKHKSYKKLAITGYTEGPKVLKRDYALSRLRATKVSDYIRSTLKPQLEKTSLDSIQETKKSAALRKVRLILSD